MDLSNNSLVELPSSIGSMKSLKHLYLQKNLIENIPDHLGQEQVLQTLDISENQLINLPEDIRKWRTLQIFLCSGNRLSQMPKSFKYLQMLETFDVSENNFVSFSFPDNCSNTIKSVKMGQNPWRLPPIGGEDNRSLVTRVHK